jgi:hypothetical protein
VPYALKNIRWLLHNANLPIQLPTLMEAFTGMLASEKLQNLGPVLETTRARESHSESKPLTVRIFSFSFHREGLPKDESGNGGGFVFDGRSLPNPGRDERFKALTGKDAPVIEYLNQQESVHQFLASVQSLVDSSVGEYRRRGFQNLMVPFRLHWRPAPVCLFGGGVGPNTAREKRRRSRGPSPRIGETGRMRAMILAAGGHAFASANDDRSESTD